LSNLNEIYEFSRKKLKNQFKDFCTGQIHRYKVQPTKMDVYTALYITADEKHMMDIVNRRVSLTTASVMGLARVEGSHALKSAFPTAMDDICSIVKNHREKVSVTTRGRSVNPPGIYPWYKTTSPPPSPPAKRGPTLPARIEQNQSEK